MVSLQICPDLYFFSTSDFFCLDFHYIKKSLIFFFFAHWGNVIVFKLSYPLLIPSTLNQTFRYSISSFIDLVVFDCHGSTQMVSILNFLLKSCLIIFNISLTKKWFFSLENKCHPLPEFFLLKLISMSQDVTLCFLSLPISTFMGKFLRSHKCMKIKRIQRTEFSVIPRGWKTTASQKVPWKVLSYLS